MRSFAVLYSLSECSNSRQIPMRFPFTTTIFQKTTSLQLDVHFKWAFCFCHSSIPIQFNWMHFCTLNLPLRDHVFHISASAALLFSPKTAEDISGESPIQRHALDPTSFLACFVVFFSANVHRLFGLIGLPYGSSFAALLSFPFPSRHLKFFLASFFVQRRRTKKRTGPSAYLLSFFYF